MYQNEGYLKPIDDREELKKLMEDSMNVPRVFQVGQILEVNGGWFRVKSVKPKELRLKAIPCPK
jgi:uncharacterized Zn finger protein